MDSLIGNLSAELTDIKKQQVYCQHATGSCV